MERTWPLLFCGLLCCHSRALRAAKLSGEMETHVNGGRDLDIFEINREAGLDLLEGDIENDESAVRNTIVDERYRWPKTIPYYLEDSLDMNAKGIILKAFEQFRLKTCIDFTPWKGEKNYISVYKGSGCSSSVGNQQRGNQTLSIGPNCDDLSVVEHEFLHALGFWHEQTRSDRDDYVTIQWDKVKAGEEHNFKKRDDKESSALNVPYDYGSVMHYSKMAFSKASDPTIITKDPQFLNVIGQQIEFSDNDLLKLNRLYNCTSSSTFLESCDFEQESICGMIQDSGVSKQWVRRSWALFGPYTDFTNMGRCKGSFMHFSTLSGTAGDRAILRSRLLYPNRGGHCLQFFLYHSGTADDKLNIYVRQYSQANPAGTLKLFKTISGGVQNSWELHHVQLEAHEVKFRVEFEGVKGKGKYTGGLSLDDINLSETTCPQHVWHIRNITGLLDTTPVGTGTWSPRFLSPKGYSFQVQVYFNGKISDPGYMAAYLHLTSGPNDQKLKWPCPWQQATISLMDQHSDIRRRMNMQRMVTTDPNKLSSDGTAFYWDDPRKVGFKVTDLEGNTFFRGDGWGYSTFLSHRRLRSRDFIKGDDAFFLLSMEDISELLRPQPMPDPASCGKDCQPMRLPQKPQPEIAKSVSLEVSEE